MSYYQENRPSMGGLADALAMQGRRGDSTLVHMNPMEVRMLESMSPDGRLSINPETGLPEAFKLKDVLGVALPIAGAALLGPAIAPALGVSGLTGAAIGTGLGGFGAGLLQGKGVGDSLIQGGLSGLMSYGLGSAFAPAAPSGGITSALPEVGSTIDATQTASGLGLGGYNPAQSTFAYAPEAVASDAGLFGKLSANLQTPIAPETLGGTTYGSALTAGGSGLLSSSLLAPEEMPYDIAGMDDMDAYYAGRVPDLEAGRRRGRARARALNMPPAFSSPAELRRTAETSGFGTFLAADGGRVPADLNINGEPHQLSYINQDEADLLRSLGGAGQDVMGIPAYFDAGEGTAGEGAPDDGSGVGAAADGSDSAPGADMGLGGYSDAQAAAVMDAMTTMSDMDAVGMDPMGVVGNVNDPNETATMGVGASQNAPTTITAAPPDIGMLGRGVLGLFGLSPKGYSVNPDMTFNAVTGIGVPGIGNAVANAMGLNTSLATVTGPTQSPGGGDIGDDDDGVGDAGGDSGVYGRPYGDPYNTEKVQVAPAPAPSPAGATALRSLSPTAPRTAGDIFRAATTGGIPRFFTGMAQGGVVQAGIGGLLKSMSPAYMFTQKPEMFSPAYMFAKKPEMMSPAYMFAKKPEMMSPAYMLAKNPEMMSPAYMAAKGKSPIETVMRNRGMAQGGGISSLAYGGEAAPVGFANKAFEGMVPGDGTGMSDDVPFSIEGNQPALLSRDEYVLPADVVSQLGDGSSGAGADMLDNFISQVRQTKYGNTQQPAPVGPQLMTGLMRQGGVV